MVSILFLVYTFTYQVASFKIICLLSLFIGTLHSIFIVVFCYVYVIYIHYYIIIHTVYYTIYTLTYISFIARFLSLD